MEIDVETTQIAAACLGIGTVTICRRKKKNKNVESEKSGCNDFPGACSPPNMY